MRRTVHALLCALALAPVAMAQEPEPSPAPEAPVDILQVRAQDFGQLPVLATDTPVQVIVDITQPEEKERDVWQWAPHLTLAYGKTTGGFIQSPYWYRVQDRRTEVPNARILQADLTAGRWSLSGSLNSVPGRPDIRSSAVGANISPKPFGPVRIGLGFRYSRSEDTTELFSSGGTTIASATTRDFISSVLDVGFGGYDRSHVRLQGYYGNARLADSLDLLVAGRAADSPLARYRFSHSDFLGVGATATYKLWGASAEGSVACFRPIQISPALPRDECVMTAGGSVLAPVWLKVGSGVGAFARKTWVYHHRPPDYQTIQFLNGSFTFGLTARVP